MRRKLSMELRSMWARAIAIALVVVLFDQIAKSVAMSASSSLIVLARNTGVITGWAPLSSSATTLLSVGVLLAFLAVVGRWAVQIGIPVVIPAVTAGGMFAHTLDRVRFGGVRDFIATGWLIIDVADLAVVAGLVALIVAGGVRAYQLHHASRTVTFELARLRAVVKDA